MSCGCKQEAPLTFQAGTYEVTAQGHNGDIRLGGNALTEILVSGRIAATSGFIRISGFAEDTTTRKGKRKNRLFLLPFARLFVSLQPQ